MKLTFDQLMRLLLLASGVVFFGVGVWMIKSGIKAEGAIDIRMEVLAGSLKSGSAGLFIMFFSFFMIVASVMFPKGLLPERAIAKKAATSGVPKLLVIMFALYAATIGSYLIARSRPDS